MGVSPESQFLKGEWDFPQGGDAPGQGTVGINAQRRKWLEEEGLPCRPEKPLQLRGWLRNLSLTPQNAGSGQSWGSLSSPAHCPCTRGAS